MPSPGPGGNLNSESKDVRVPRVPTIPSIPIPGGGNGKGSGESPTFEGEWGGSDGDKKGSDTTGTGNGGFDYGGLFGGIGNIAQDIYNIFNSGRPSPPRGSPFPGGIYGDWTSGFPIYRPMGIPGGGIQWAPYDEVARDEFGVDDGGVGQMSATESIHFFGEPGSERYNRFKALWPEEFGEGETVSVSSDWWETFNKINRAFPLDDPSKLRIYNDGRTW